MRAEKPHAMFCDDGQRNHLESGEIYQPVWSMGGRENGMLKGNICSGPAMTHVLFVSSSVHSSLDWSLGEWPYQLTDLPSQAGPVYSIWLEESSLLSAN